MKFISNDKIDLILNTLRDPDFTFSDLEALDNSKFDGDKFEYGYLSSCIKIMNAEIRDVIYTNSELCIKSKNIPNDYDIFLQAVNHIILEIPRASELEMLRVQSKRYSDSMREFRKMKRDFYEEFDNFEDEFKGISNKFSNFESEFKNTQKSFSNFSSQFENIEKEFKAFENRLGNIQNEFIGILSIFSAIIIAFFGGVQILGEVIANVKISNFYVLSMATILIGLILFNVIYMLLYTVGKIIDKNIGIKISRSKCDKCDKNNVLSCLVSKYPLPYFFNLFSVIGFIIIFIIFILDTNGILKFLFSSFIWMVKNQKWINLSLITFGLIASISLLRVWFTKKVFNSHRNKSCFNDISEDNQYFSRAPN